MKTKETFKEVFNDTINIEKDLAASSALRRNENSDYLKMDDSINNKNNRTTWINVARDNNKNCIICKKPGHVAENCYHLTIGQEPAKKKLISLDLVRSRQNQDLVRSGNLI